MIEQRSLSLRTEIVTWGDYSPRLVARIAQDEYGWPIRWNGWLVPYFSRKQIDVYIAWRDSLPANVRDDFSYVEWSGDDLLVFKILDESDPDDRLDPDRLTPVEGCYALGGWAWTWQTAEAL